MRVCVCNFSEMESSPNANLSQTAEKLICFHLFSATWRLPEQDGVRTERGRSKVRLT